MRRQGHQTVRTTGGEGEARAGGGGQRAGSPGRLQAKPEPARPTHEYYSTCPSCCSMLYLLASVVSAAGCCCSIFIGLCSVLAILLLLLPLAVPPRRPLTRPPRQDPTRRPRLPSSRCPVSFGSLSQAPELLIVSSRLHIDHCNSRIIQTLDVKMMCRCVDPRGNGRGGCRGGGRGDQGERLT